MMHNLACQSGLNLCIIIYCSNPTSVHSRAHDLAIRHGDCHQTGRLLQHVSKCLVSKIHFLERKKMRRAVRDASDGVIVAAGERSGDVSNFYVLQEAIIEI